MARRFLPSFLLALTTVTGMLPAATASAADVPFAAPPALPLAAPPIAGAVRDGRAPQPPGGDPAGPAGDRPAAAPGG